jgi:hypothetical protein
MRMCAHIPGVLIIVCGVAIATLESQSSIGRNWPPRAGRSEDSDR